MQYNVQYCTKVTLCYNAVSNLVNTEGLYLIYLFYIVCDTAESTGRAESSTSCALSGSTNYIKQPEYHLKVFNTDILVTYLC